MFVSDSFLALKLKLLYMIQNSISIIYMPILFWQVFTVNDGRARQNWELISDQVSVFSPVNYVDWSLYVSLGKVNLCVCSAH